MSECVVRMEMPLDCQYCPMAHWDIRGRLMGCEAANGKRYLQGKDDEFWKDGRPSWCPIICSLPEGHGRLVEESDVIRLINKWFDTIGLNPDIMIDGIKSLPTIVPADTAERSEA